MVPKAEKNRAGGGVREASCLAHCEVSSETNAVSLAWGAVLAASGVRREMASTREIDGFARTVFRIWVPFMKSR